MHYVTSIGPIRRVHASSTADSSDRLTALSYELRSPLTGISGYAQLLSDELSDHDSAFTYATHIQKSTEQLNEVLDSILEMNYLDAGKIGNHPEHISLRKTLAPMIDAHKRKADENRLDFHIEWPLIDQVFIDPTLLTSTIRHLLDNAIKFTRTGGIFVELVPADNSLKLIVRDTGIGIRSESLSHVFRPYWQESQGISRTYRGLGIGLSIVRDYVDLMNGTIHIVSTTDVGTTVAIDIPLIVRSDTSLGPKLHIRRKILYVEDDHLIQTLVNRILSGHELDICSTAEEALDRAKSVQYDAVFMDIQLGHGMTGQQLCRILRAMPGYEHTPIAAVTAMDVNLLARSDQNLFSHFMSKPFVRKRLQDLLEQMMVD